MLATKGSLVAKIAEEFDKDQSFADEDGFESDWSINKGDEGPLREESDDEDGVVLVYLASVMTPIITPKPFSCSNNTEPKSIWKMNYIVKKKQKSGRALPTSSKDVSKKLTAWHAQKRTPKWRHVLCNMICIQVTSQH